MASLQQHHTPSADPVIPPRANRTGVWIALAVIASLAIVLWVAASMNRTPADAPVPGSAMTGSVTDPAAGTLIPNTATDTNGLGAATPGNGTAQGTGDAGAAGTGTAGTGTAGTGTTGAGNTGAAAPGTQ